MVKFKEVFFLLVFVILLTAFVFAAHVLTPLTYDNGFGFSYNESSSSSAFNITVNNTDVGDNSNITQVNITLPSDFTFENGTESTDSLFDSFENTSTILSWTNLTTYLINGAVTGDGVWNYFLFNATASIPGSYNITVVTLNGEIATEQNISVEINDTSSPLVYFNSPSETENLSQDFVEINITADDSDGTYAGVFDTIVYYLFYENGTQINSTNSIVNSEVINFTGLSEGTYNINATANDTLGNDNTTGTGTWNITLDTTVPSTVFNCTPTTVDNGGTVNCSCGGTDSLSGVNTIDYSEHPSTSTNGQITTTCNITDYAGNSNSSSVEYTVNAVSSTSSSSSGGGSNTTTNTTSNSTSNSSTPSPWVEVHSATDDEIKSGYSKALADNERVKIIVNNETHYVGVLNVTETTAKISVSSTPQEAILSVGDGKKFEVNNDTYYDILVRLESIISNKANITITSIRDPVPNLNGEEADESSLGKISVWIWIFIGLVIIIAAVVGSVVYYKREFYHRVYK